MTDEPTKELRELKEWALLHLIRSRGSNPRPKDIAPLWGIKYLFAGHEEIWQDLMYELEDQLLISEFVCPECGGKLDDQYKCECGESF